ncbi:MAG: POTRA domain-containing protein [Marinomonas foliarum]|uniref:POTRA domain-containing protein n=1 Tax=Marinomonas foliarum TaxID=491950 RepID=UPI003F9ADA04
MDGKKHGGSVLLRSCICLALLSISLWLEAAQENSIRDETEWRLRDKAAQEALEQKLERVTPPIQLPNVEALPELSEEGVCFGIESIEIEGLLSDWAKSEGEKYIGACLGVENIQAYVRLINQKLLSEGYITSRALFT